MKLRSVLSAVALVSGLAFSSTAHAFPQLDFGVIAPTSGSISYAGGANPLVGTNIEVDNVVKLIAVATGVDMRNCISCTLNFTTGNFVSSTATSWTFGGGGTISIVGGVDLTNDGDANDAGDIPVGTTLLSGSFQAVPSGPTVLSLGGTNRIAGAAFLDTKHPDLTAFYGMPDGPYSGFFNLSFQASGTPPGGFSSIQVFSGDIINEPVDLPSSLLLLGSGLVGFAYLTARRRS